MVQLLFIRVLRELIWILGSFLSRFSGGKFYKLKKNSNKWKNKTKQNKKNKVWLKLITINFRKNTKWMDNELAWHQDVNWVEQESLIILSRTKL